jgi:hypothetical protein
MKQATIFNRASGEIIRWGDFDDNDLTITTVPGEDFVVGIFDGHKYFVDTQTNEAKLIPPSPTPHHVFKCTTKQWEDPRTLADLKAAQWAQVKQARSQAEYAGFTWDGSVFDSDAISQNRITGAVALAQMSSTFSIGWVLADNTVRTLNQSDMLAVGAALGAHVAAVFAKGVLLREVIAAAGTPAEIEAIAW